MHRNPLDPDDDDDDGEGRQMNRADGGRPFCILWTPIHPITAFAPFVGHMGVCDSAGRLHDWGGGPISACSPTQMLFGSPTRYLKMSPADPQEWDRAVAQADREFLDKIHCMVCGSDCHSHVARVLDIVSYSGCRCHNKVELATNMFFCGSHTSCGAAVYTWLPFLIFCAVLILFNL